MTRYTVDHILSNGLVRLMDHEQNIITVPRKNIPGELHDGSCVIYSAETGYRVDAAGEASIRRQNRASLVRLFGRETTPPTPQDEAPTESK